MPNAVVIGGGGIGVASAHYLNRAGWDVTLVERGKVGHACSYGNSCLVVPSHSEPLPGPGVVGQALKWMAQGDSPFYIRPRFDPGLFKFFWRFRKYCSERAAEDGFRALLSLSQKSIELYREILDAGDASFFFERRGLMEVFLTPSGLDYGRRAQELLTAERFTSTILSRDDALAMEPALSPSILGGLFTEGEAHGYSYGYVTSLAATLEKRGVRILTETPVTGLVNADGRVRGVELPSETIDADTVVLAAGSWSPEIAAQVGVSIPLQPAKGYSATIDNYEGAPTLPVLVKERRVIVTPLEKRLRFGGTLELTGYDDSIHRARYDAVVRGGREVLKTPPPMENEEAWSGLRPVTPDGLPIIDRARNVDGLIVATGHAMLGFTQSPITGKLVAELANDEAPSVPLHPFRLDRF